MPAIQWEQRDQVEDEQQHIPENHHEQESLDKTWQVSEQVVGDGKGNRHQQIRERTRRHRRQKAPAGIAHAVGRNRGRSQNAETNQHKHDETGPVNMDRRIERETSLTSRNGIAHKVGDVIMGEFMYRHADEYGDQDTDNDFRR